MAKAKVFRSGNSQAIRIPKEFRFDTEEVEISRRGNEVVLKSKPKNLAAVFDVLAGLSDDFLKHGRKQPPLQKRSNL